MKNLIFILLVLLCSNFSNALTIDDKKSDIVIENNEIKAKDKVLGKIKADEKEIVAAKARIKSHVVSIYNKKGTLVATYDVKSVLKQSKKERNILEASLKTHVDNVTHTGSNFLDFNFKIANKVDQTAPQFSRVIEYLIQNKYM
jgi:phospholipase C